KSAWSPPWAARGTCARIVSGWFYHAREPISFTGVYAVAGARKNSSRVAIRAFATKLRRPHALNCTRLGGPSGLRRTGLSQPLISSTEESVQRTSPPWPLELQQAKPRSDCEILQRQSRAKWRRKSQCASHHPHMGRPRTSAPSSSRKDRLIDDQPTRGWVR